MTPAQKRFVTDIVKVWFTVKCHHEDFFRTWLAGDFEPEWLAGKVAVDLDHSRMWRRLLAGETLSAEPPGAVSK